NAPVSYFHKPKLQFHHRKHMLDFRAHLRLRAILRALTPPARGPVRDTLDRPTLASRRRAADPAAPANPPRFPASPPPHESTYSYYPRPRAPSSRSTTASPCASGASPDHAAARGS